MDVHQLGMYVQMCINILQDQYAYYLRKQENIFFVKKYLSKKLLINKYPCLN